MRKYQQGGMVYLVLAMLWPGLALLPEALASSPASAQVRTILVHPQGETLLVATRQGLVRSHDDGHTWESVPSPATLPGQQVLTLAMHPQQPSRLYAGGHPFGIVRSDNAGQSWQPSAQGLPGTAVPALVADPRRPQQLYAWVVEHGVYRSRDSGRSWQRVADGPPEPAVQALASVNIPTGMGGIFLYAGTAEGVWKSPD